MTRREREKKTNQDKTKNLTAKYNNNVSPATSVFEKTVLLTTANIGFSLEVCSSGNFFFFGL